MTAPQHATRGYSLHRTQIGGIRRLLTEKPGRCGALTGTWWHRSGAPSPASADASARRERIVGHRTIGLTSRACHLCVTNAFPLEKTLCPGVGIEDAAGKSRVGAAEQRVPTETECLRRPGTRHRHRFIEFREEIPRSRAQDPRSRGRDRGSCATTERPANSRSVPRADGRCSALYST